VITGSVRLVIASTLPLVAGCYAEVAGGFNTAVGSRASASFDPNFSVSVGFQFDAYPDHRYAASLDVDGTSFKTTDGSASSFILGCGLATDFTLKQIDTLGLRASARAAFGPSGIDFSPSGGSGRDAGNASLYSFYAGATLVFLCRDDSGCFQLSFGPQFFAAHSTLTGDLLVVGPQFRVTIPLSTKDLNDLTGDFGKGRRAAQGHD
jgi:hypothetical protein